MKQYDVVVVGLGAMGSAATCHLAKAGQRVLGLDQFTPPHELGSSHGQTRIIREAYFEHPIYVPLLQRAYELWAELERPTGRRLFLQTGGLMIGPTAGVVVSGARRSAQEHRLAHRLLSAEQLREEFPMFNPTSGMSAVWEPRAGILFPEECIRAHLQAAQQAGAELRFNERVAGWSASGGAVEVRTERGRFGARQMLCTAGAWIGKLAPELKLPLRVERQVLYWFEARAQPELFRPERCPIYLFEFEPERFFYGFPDLGGGVKVARHHEGSFTEPDTLDREIHPFEVDEMRQLLRKYLPCADGGLHSSTVCMYTDAPDGHFVIDRHPGAPEVLLASPCSGHGFKFASVLGEVLTELLVKGVSRFDLRLFGLGRLFS